MKNSPFYVIDGYSLIYRSYFAFMKAPLFNKKHENTSALFGFFRILFSFFDQYKPEYLAIAMDSIGPTFRHEKYDLYKATRDKTPDDLHAQIPRIEKILESIGLQTMRVNGFEADDIIATFAGKCKKAGQTCVIITSDKDLMQLVGDNVSVLRPSSGSSGYEELGRDGVFEKYGVYPEQIADYLSLTGDSSDNIPGVRGIGPKTATSLLATYGTLNEIYSNVGEIKGASGKKLAEDKENCMLSRELVTLRDDVPIFPATESEEDNSSVLENFALSSIDFSKAFSAFEEENAKKLISWIEKNSSGDIAFQSNSGSYIENSTKETTVIVPEALQGKGSYKAITTIEELDILLEEVKKAKFFAFDIETDGLDTVTANPVGFSISFKSKTGYYIPLVAEEKKVLPESIVKSKLRTLLEDKSLSLVGQNIKFDYKVLRKWGIKTLNIYFDTMVAAWILNSHLNSFSMDNLAESFLGYTTIHYKDLFPDTKKENQNFKQVPLDKATEYAAEDADITFRLYEVFKEQIKEQKMEKLFFDLEMPILVILAEMEIEGVRIRKEVLESYGKELGDKIGVLEKDIHKICGKEFNVNSTKQLQEVLFTDRQLKAVKKTKTGYSTDNSVLEELARGDDPIPVLVLRFRSLSKLKSTYVDSLPLLCEGPFSKIHTTYRQTGTTTGRLSSISPNLQNIPIKDEEGRRIRKAFIPSAGRVFMSADYSQIELVVLAHLSGDPALIEAFTKGTDVHALTASFLFNILPEEVTQEQRRTAKTINFGIIYGMSSYRLAGELSIPRAVADNFISSYFDRYSSIRNFIDETIKFVEETGYVETLLGRRRYIEDINNKNKTVKRGAERMAVNTPIQGSAADIVKLSMLKVVERIEKEKLKTSLVLQVHDELILEVPDKEIESVRSILRSEMEGAVKLKVPLRVTIETGESWGDMH